MHKKKKQPKGIIYSTKADFEFNYEDNQIKTLAAKEQNLKIYIDKHRSGKIAVLIKNFVGNTEDLKTLSKILKKGCGVGGSVKNGEIIIQGNNREKVIEILTKEGYPYKRVGG